jgi:kinesin family protein C1
MLISKWQHLVRYVSCHNAMAYDNLIFIISHCLLSMHNAIQELRVNVQVLACFRPFLPDDSEQGNNRETPSVDHFGDEQVSVAKLSNPSQWHKLSLDSVFAPSAGQKDVFVEVLGLVQSALDGYNVCLFLYGQTGSGKIHTMQGADIGVMRGLIPWCLKQIGLYKVAKEKDGWEFLMEVSFLKIYNELLKDLLCVNMSQECKHEINVGTDGRRMVTDLTVKVIDPNDQAPINAILALATKHQATESMDMNATSSRLHAVLTLNITAMHVEQNQVVRGTLNLVDLAGLE